MKSNKTFEKDLGAALEQDGIISSEQWQNVLAIHSKSGKEISQILVGEGLVTAQELATLAAMEHGVPFVNLNQQKIEPQALQLIPEAMARKYNALAIKVVNGVL